MDNNMNESMEVPAVEAEKEPVDLSDALTELYREKLKNKHGVDNEGYRQTMENVREALDENPNIIRIDHHTLKSPIVELEKKLHEDNRAWSSEWTKMLGEPDGTKKLFELLTGNYFDEKWAGTVRAKGWLPVCILEDVKGIHMPALYLIKADAPDVEEVTNTMKLFQHEILNSLPEEEEEEKEEESPEQRIAA